MALTTDYRGLSVGAKILAILAAVLVVGSSNPICRADDAADKTYPIKLFRPSHVGEKYEVSATGSKRQRYEIKVPGKDTTFSDRKTAAKLDGFVEVLAVDTKGQQTKLACTVKKFVRTDGKEPTEILPTGAVIVAESVKKDEKTGIYETRFTLKDGELTQDQKTALAVIIRMPAPDSATADEVIGTDKPQKVGATWSINAAKLAEHSKKVGFSTDPQDIKGEVTLVETVVGDHKYLEVKGQVSARNVKIPLDSSVKIESSEIVGKFSGTITETDRPNHGSEDFTLTMQTKSPAPDGSIATVITFIESHGEAETRAVR